MTEWNDIERLVHDRIDGSTTPADDAKLDAALASDPELARRARELVELVDGLRGLDRERAPTDFAQRVMQRVDAARLGGRRGWNWSALGPALMAAAAIVVAAVWIGRDDTMPPTLGARAPAVEEAVANDAAPPAAAAPKKSDRPLPGGTEAKPAPAPSAPAAGFLSGGAPDDAVLDALESALQRNVWDFGVASDDALKDEEAKDDRDEASVEKSAVDPVSSTTADSESADDVRIVLLRRGASERKQRGVAARTDERGSSRALEDLLPAPLSSDASERSDLAAKRGDSKSQTAPTDGEESDRWSELAQRHADRVRDVALDDDALAALIERARERGFVALELDDESLALEPSPASVAQEERASLGRYRWREIVANGGESRTKDKAAESATAPPRPTMKKASPDATKRRRTIVVLVDD